MAGGNLPGNNFSLKSLLCPDSLPFSLLPTARRFGLASCSIIAVTILQIFQINGGLNAPLVRSKAFKAQDGIIPLYLNGPFDPFNCSIHR